MSNHESNSGEEDTPFQRGHVVWIDRSDQIECPFLILSIDSLRVDGPEYLGVRLSTVDSENAVRIEPGDWIIGGISKPAFALASTPQIIPHQVIEQGIGAISEESVEEVAQSS